MNKDTPQTCTYISQVFGISLYVCCLFQVVDLRWGVREEAQDDHATIDVCLQEIENCKASSVGPSFVVSI